MDDERQAGPARGLDMDAQAFLLHGLGVGGVVVVEPGLADADEFRVRGQRHQLVDRGHRFFGGAHRVGAGGPEDRRHGPRRWRAPAARSRSRVEMVTMRVTPASAARATTASQLALEIGEIEVAMAVGDLRLGSCGPVHAALRSRSR